MAQRPAKRVGAKRRRPLNSNAVKVTRPSSCSRPNFLSSSINLSSLYCSVASYVSLDSETYCRFMPMIHVPSVRVSFDSVHISRE